MIVQIEKSESLSRVPTVVHGFFTRGGGCSEKPFLSLNCSLKVGDLSHHVEKNRMRALSGLQLAKRKLFIPNIVHGNNSIIVDENSCEKKLATIEADALITTTENMVLGITYADCVPILLASDDGCVVAAIHSGWRGIQNEIIPKTVQKIRDVFNPKKLIAAVGPAISKESFVVKNEVLDYFEDNWPTFVTSEKSRGFVDLRNIVCRALKEIGVVHSEKVGDHTDLVPEKYFSHRRDKGASGRHLAIIARTKRL